MPTLPELHGVLRLIADETGLAEVHFATLGSLIRQKLPGFSPDEYGFSSFTDLMLSCSEVGIPRFGNNSEDRWFVFGGDVSGESVRPTSHTVSKPLWDACVQFDESRQAWLDFRDCRHIETDPGVVDEEPERYLEIPRFDRTRQLSLLRAFSAGHEREDAIRQIIDTWSSEMSHSRLLGAPQKLGVRNSWLAYFRKSVTDELRTWAGNHGVPSGSLFSRRARRTSVACRAERNLPFALGEVELRTFLKRAIDQMTLAELGQLPVPARLLLNIRPGN